MEKRTRKATEDPQPSVAGHSIEALRAVGLVVTLVAATVVGCGAGPGLPVGCPETGEIQLDPETGLPLHATTRLGTLTWLPKVDRVWAISLSPDGQTLVTGTMPGSMKSPIEIWDTQTRESLGMLVEDAHNTLSLAFSPDGRWLAVGVDYRLEIWDFAKRVRVSTWQPPPDKEGKSGFWSLRWSHDGTRIAGVAASIQRVHVWESRTCRPLVQRDYGTGIHAVAFSPDDRKLAVAGMKKLEILDAKTLKTSQRFAGIDSEAFSVAFSPDNTELAAAIACPEKKSRVAIWDTKTGRRRRAFEEFPGSYTEIAYTENGTTIATSGWAGKIRLWDAVSGQLRHTLAGKGHVGRYFSISQDSSLLATGDARVSLWDVKTGKNLHAEETHLGGVASVAFTEAGRTVVSASSDGTVRCWDAASGRQRKILCHDDRLLLSLAVSPDETLLAIGDGDGWIRLRDLRTGELRNQICAHVPEPHDSPPPGVAGLDFSPDGKQLLSGGRDATVRIWNVADLKLARTIKVEGLVAHAQWSPRATHVAWSTFGGNVRLFDLSTGTESIPLSGSEKPMMSPFVFSPDGLRIAVAGAANTEPSRDVSSQGGPASRVVLWDCDRGKTVWSARLTQRIDCLAFSPDGTLIASGGESPAGSICVWCARTGERLMSLRGHRGQVRDLAFSPDSTRLVSASQDTTLFVWDVKPAQTKAKDLE